MIVVRFKVACKPEVIEQAKAAFREVIPPSRNVAGVMHFDIGQDLHDPNCIIATEVFADRAALERQESLPAVQNIIARLPDFLAGQPEATIFHVSSSEPWGE